MKMKTICLVVPSLTCGGGVPAVARFVTNTAVRSGRYNLKLVSLSMSSSDECSVQILRPTSWRQGVTAKVGQWEGRSFVHVGAFLGELEFQRYRPRQKLKHVLEECDLVQVVSGSPAWANAVIGLGKPVALQVATRALVERRQRDRHARGAKGWWRKAMTRVTDAMDKRALMQVDAVQVENPWMFDYVRDLNVGREVDIRYAPPGIDAHFFRPVSRRELRTDPYILCVGRLSDPRKNVGLLLEAYALIPEAVRGDARLVLAGSSAPPEAFWARVHALGLQGRVEYYARPSREVLLRLYQEATAFALPSDEEGLGVVLLEAMACGVPVVSTRSGGPEGIITDGADGYLVQLNDAETMADRLGKLLIDQEFNFLMGQKARQTAEFQYDELVAGAVFIEMWDKLLTDPGV